MTVSLKHTFVSAIADSADASLVQPSSWNAEHTLTLGANVLLGAVTAGAAQEIGLGAGLSFSGGNLVVSGFAASSHSHVIADVTGLQSALDGKQAAGSYQPLATVLTNTTAAFTTTLEAKLSGVATGATANSSDATLLDRANHTGSQAAATISDFNAAARAQVEAELVAGANVTITPSGSGATRQLTIASTGGGGSSLGGLVTVTIANDAYDWTETVAAIGVAPASRVMVGLAPANDTDENDPLWLSTTQMVASAGTDEITISMAFETKEHGPIKLHWSAL